MNKLLLTAIAVSPLSLISFSYAQQTQVVDVNETMVITANRFEQPAQLTLADIEIVTRQDIERIQAKSIPDVLRRLTGIQISQNGGRGQVASIFVRGSASDQVLVLVDGVRFSRAVKGSVDFNQIPLTYVDRIEYVKGARASLYGSEAIGGVINIITIARSKTEGTKLSAGLGSLDHTELSIASGVSVSESGQLNLALGHEESKGYNVRPIAGVNDGDRHGFNSLNGLVGYTHSFNEQWSLFGNVRAYENVTQYDNSFGSHQYYESEREDKSFTLGGKYQSAKWMTEIQLNTQEQKSWNYQKLTGKYSGYSDQFEQTNAQMINYYQLSDIVALATGLDWRNESYLDKGINKKFERLNFAVFGVATAHLSSSSLEASVRFDDNEEFGSQSTYQLVARYQFEEEFGVKASYGTGFKAPNLYQQYDPFYGSKNLKSEESQSLELVFDGYIDELYWTLTAYDNKINNLIDYHPATYQFVNVDGTTRVKGLELAATFDTGIIQHQLSADYKNPEDRSGKTLQRRAKQMYKWNALVSFDQVDLSLGYLYIGKRSDVDYNVYPSSNVTLSGYSMVDTAATYYINDSASISARVDNLLNAKYQATLGYPAPERAYYVTLSYQF